MLGIEMKAIATLTISNAAGMTVAGRAAMATWLAFHGGELIRRGRGYSKRFRARYIYVRPSKTKS